MRRYAIMSALCLGWAAVVAFGSLRYQWSNTALVAVFWVGYSAIFFGYWRRSSPSGSRPPASERTRH